MKKNYVISTKLVGINLAAYVCIVCMALFMILLPLKANAEEYTTGQESSMMITYDVPANWEIRIPTYIDLSNGVSMAQIASNYVHSSDGKVVYVDINAEQSEYNSENGTIPMYNNNASRSIDLKIYGTDGIFGQGSNQHVAIFDNNEREDIIPAYNIYFEPIVPNEAYAESYHAVIYFNVYCA